MYTYNDVSLDGIQSVLIQDTANVVLDIRPESNSSISVEKEEFLKYFKITRLGNKLLIESNKNKSKNMHNSKDIQTNGNMSIIITGNNLSYSTNNFESYKIFLALPQLNRIVTEGASIVSGTIITKSLEIKSSGASEIKLDGGVSSLHVKTSGASGIKLKNLASENTMVLISGASDVIVNSTNSISGHVSGASNVTFYSIKPPQLKSSGASNVKQKNDQNLINPYLQYGKKMSNQLVNTTNNFTNEKVSNNNLQTYEEEEEKHITKNKELVIDKEKTFKDKKDTDFNRKLKSYL